MQISHKLYTLYAVWCTHRIPCQCECVPYHYFYFLRKMYASFSLCLNDTHTNNPLFNRIHSENICIAICTKCCPHSLPRSNPPSNQNKMFVDIYQRLAFKNDISRASLYRCYEQQQQTSHTHTHWLLCFSLHG